MDEQPSKYALRFAERRLEEVFQSLSKLSPSLSESVRSSAGAGDATERMRRASDAIRAAADAVRREGRPPGAMGKEFEKALGKSYSKGNALAMLSAHAEGLSALSSPAGLGGAILLHHAADLRGHMILRAKEAGTDPEILESALGHLDSWVRSLLMQGSAGDPDDPVRMLAYCRDEEDARRWTGKLIIRCIHYSDDEAVKQLITESFHSWAGGGK